MNAITRRFFLSHTTSASSVRSMTGGLGDYSYEFSRYEQAPGDVQKREIEARAAAKDGE